MTCPRLIPAIAAFMALILQSACGSSSPISGPVQGPPLPDQRPADFIMSATVFSPRAAEAVSLPRSLRPARYIVEADGVLRAGTGTDVGINTFPPQTRRLTARQWDALWREVRDSGLLDPGSPARVDDPETLQRDPTRTTALFFISFAETRATLRVPLDRSDDVAVSAERVVDQLAELAWMRD
jgi:hypothetical protein